MIYDNFKLKAKFEKKGMNIDDMRSILKALSHSIQETLWAKIHQWPMTARVDGHVFHIWHPTHL